MKKALTILLGTNGLNTVYDSTRLGMTNVNEIPLVKAVNVDIDNTGRISTANGYSNALTGSWHSLFSLMDMYTFVGVCNDNLVHVDQNLNTTILLNNIPTVVSYVSTFNGIMEEVFFCAGGSVNGVIKNTQIYPWDFLEPVEPIGTVKYSAVPIGNLLDIMGGRIFIAKDNLLLWTQPFAYYCINLLDYIQFDSTIKMLICLETGIWVGTQSGLYFLSGRIPKEFELRKILTGNVVSNTAVRNTVRKDGNPVGINVYVTLAKDGIYVLEENGKCYPVTYDKYRFPNSYSGFAYIDGNDKYTVYMEE